MADEEAREDVHEAAPEPVAPDDEVAAALVERFAGSVFDRSHGQPVVYVDRAVMADVALLLRDEEQFTMLVDTVVVDHVLDGSRVSVDGVRYVPAAGSARTVATERYEVVANFLSHVRNRRVRVICAVPDSDPSVPSLTGVYPGTNFAERETYDFFGIDFVGHPDLTRILMPDDWEGHPLRKDYPAARVPVTFKGDPHPR